MEGIPTVDECIERIRLKLPKYEGGVPESEFEDMWINFVRIIYSNLEFALDTNFKRNRLTTKYIELNRYCSWEEHPAAISIPWIVRRPGIVQTTLKCYDLYGKQVKIDDWLVSLHTGRSIRRSDGKKKKHGKINVDLLQERKKNELKRVRKINNNHENFMNELFLICLQTMNYPMDIYTFTVTNSVYKEDKVTVYLGIKWLTKNSGYRFQGMERNKIDNPLAFMNMKKIQEDRDPYEQDRIKVKRIKEILVDLGWILDSANRSWYDSPDSVYSIKVSDNIEKTIYLYDSKGEFNQASLFIEDKKGPRKTLGVYRLWHQITEEKFREFLSS